ncbi:4a-hydroxytetrahydrobiopterin dehydratase [Geosmithia morbida]|uniref:4a-hydroxytetrahydrobiopterin dehydratase n=1 Tax=Geosmithia morbida TaxID=1094350 RepID=A0A9P5D550_9HYPO|nr:4a-hydroxytetrahydrobiopterin dehydratase [Geosmithia morbida]KAF4126812.1 4a-hydroxytetrahydrobiopterin dehydratase [Geosmithia morbida]
MLRLFKSSQLHSVPSLSPTSAAAAAAAAATATSRIAITPLARAMSSSTQKPRFSEGTEEASASSSLDSLLSGHWTLTNEGEALERSFKFKTFAKTWVYNTAFIRWTTHHPKGLSTKDLELAAACDSIARDFGELEPEPVSCEVRSVADRATTSAGDCCIPKKSG